MNLTIATHRFSYSFPAPSEPAWSAKVERWYQLDAAAYGLVQSYEEMKDRLGPAPDLIVLASPRASNTTDRSFALTGASSPSKFVHTLSNVRGAPLLQVMEWGGPVLCVQDDPRTILNGIDQALAFLELEPELQRAWIISVTEDASKPSGEAWTVSYFVLSEYPAPIRIETRQENDFPTERSDAPTDSLWLEWVCNASGGSFNLSRYHKAIIGK